MTSARRLFKGTSAYTGNGKHLDRVGDATSEPLHISGTPMRIRVDWQAVHGRQYTLTGKTNDATDGCAMGDA